MVSDHTERIPRLYAAASLKLEVGEWPRPRGRDRIPRLYAAASLKLGRVRRLARRPGGIPRLYAAASLKLDEVDGVDAIDRRGIPRLYAAASLKPGLGITPVAHVLGIPRLYAAASLKLPIESSDGITQLLYSAALCRGLIEACHTVAAHSATAGYSAALCRGLIEASSARCPRWPACTSYSAALCRGLIEACRPTMACTASTSRIPRLYAAASLKPDSPSPITTHCKSYSRLYAAASLKLAPRTEYRVDRVDVFRGSMPRPH